MMVNKDFQHLVQRQLIEDEEVIWSGKPEPPFTITILELGSHYDPGLGFVNRLKLFIIVAAIIYIGLAMFHFWLFKILFMLLVPFVLFLPDIIKHYRRVNTSYIVTNRRICFRLWYWGRSSVQFVDLAKVSQITWQEYEDKSGILHFLTFQPLDFDTYDFISGLHRHYPTFENIPNVMEVFEKIEPYRLARIREITLIKSTP